MSPEYAPPPDSAGEFRYPGVAVLAAEGTSAIGGGVGTTGAAVGNLVPETVRGRIGASYCDGASYGFESWASIVRNVTFSNSSSRISVAGAANGLLTCGLTSRTCVEKGVDTGLGSTKMMSVPKPLMALVSP